MKKFLILMLTLVLAIGGLSLVGCGATGERASGWRTGRGAPTEDRGLTGDFYLDLNDYSLYKKTTDGWFVASEVETIQTANVDLNVENGFTVDCEVKYAGGKVESNSYVLSKDPTVFVDSVDSLETAIADGNNAILTEDITITKTIVITNDFNLYLQASITQDMKTGRAFQVASDVDFVVDAGVQAVTVSGWGFIEFPANVKNATLTMFGGNYTGVTDYGAFIKFRTGHEDIHLELYDLSVALTGTYSIIATAGTGMTNHSYTVRVVGGYYQTDKIGFELYGAYSSNISNATIVCVDNAVHTGCELVEIRNCVINCELNGKHEQGSNGIIASTNGGIINVYDCIINANYDEAVADPSKVCVFIICSSGGNIVATGCTITREVEDLKMAINTAVQDHPSVGPVSGLVTVDGEVIVKSVDSVVEVG